MLVSIITVNLNNLAGLRRTVASVVSQSWRGFEYIVIDGGSVDGSREFLEEKQEHFSYWVSEKDAGVYAAMNKGIRKAKGEYVLFLNSGDYLVGDDILEKVQPELTGEGIIYGNLISFDGAHHQVVEKFKDKLDPVYVFDHSLPHPATFIRRQLFEKVGYYNEKDRITSDWQFFMSALWVYHVDYKNIKHAITVFDRSGSSNDSLNTGLIQEEKEAFVIQNPAIGHEIFSAFQTMKSVLKDLRNSRTLKFLMFLGIMRGFKDYFSKQA